MGHCSASWQEKKKGHGKLRMALKGISWKVKYRCMAVVFWVLFCKADINSAKQQCFFCLQAAYVTCKHVYLSFSELSSLL